MSDARNTILQRLLLNISDIYNKAFGSIFYETQKALAIELESIYSKIEGILSNGFALTASGVYLDNKVAEQGLERKSATYATGIVNITGEVGAVVSIGDKVASDNVSFSITQSVTIAEGGSVAVNVIADIEGDIGNVPIESIKTFPVTISGLTAVTNEIATSGGYNAEEDDDLRKRYLEKVAVPATSGNKYHYAIWAKEVPGVGDVKVAPLWNGPGTVKVIIINSDKQAADQPLIDTVTAHIDESHPIGASVTVASATAKPINVSFSIVLDTNAVLGETEIDINKNLTDFIARAAYNQDYISYAGVGFAILNSNGVKDYVNLKLNNTTGNIAVADEEVAVLGTVTIT